MTDRIVCVERDAKTEITVKCGYGGYPTINLTTSPTQHEHKITEEYIYCGIGTLRVTAPAQSGQPEHKITTLFKEAKK